MENFNKPVVESYFERSQRLEREKREVFRGEIKLNLGSELGKFILKKYSPKEGKQDFPQLKETREEFLAIANRFSSNELEVDDLEKIESLIKEIGNYISYWGEKSRDSQEAMDAIIRFQVLEEELKSYLKNPTA